MLSVDLSSAGSVSVRNLKNYPGLVTWAASHCKTSEQHAWLIGGYFKQGSEYVSHHCLRFELASNSWQKMPSMNVSRYGCSSCYVAGSLYVFCGISNDNYVNSIEKLKIIASLSEQKE